MNCLNCKYYLKHYILTERGYSEIRSGHCKISKLNRRMQKGLLCEFFKEISKHDETEKKEKITKECLQSVERLLANLCNYLQIDKADKKKLP